LRGRSAAFAVSPKHLFETSGSAYDVAEFALPIWDGRAFREGVLGGRAGLSGKHCKVRAPFSSTKTAEERA